MGRRRRRLSPAGAEVRTGRKARGPLSAAPGPPCVAPRAAQAGPSQVFSLGLRVRSVAAGLGSEKLGSRFCRLLRGALVVRTGGPVGARPAPPGPAGLVVCPEATRAGLWAAGPLSVS